MLSAMAIGWAGGSLFLPLRGLVAVMFGFMTFVTALKTSWRDLGNIFRKPLALIVIVVLQHLLTPLSASLISESLLPGNAGLIAGFVLAAALPVGITGVIWTGLAKGDVALSLTSATIDTLLSPVVVTVIMLLFAGQKVEIAYLPIIASLFKMIVIPSILGLTVHDLSQGSFHKNYIQYLGPVSFFCMCAVIMINTGAAQGAATEMIRRIPVVFLISFGMVIFGFISGWLLARVFAFTAPVTRSCIFCAGIRNTSAGLVIALGHFPVEASIPILIAMIFQQPVAAVAQRIMFRFQKE
ncbi:MAG TPA: bile acid:sodium symporter family protein [Candidatus Rifleibacterium sp.]|nr:bile acid:sodium symporter family protein [Candidatus Rifleibacterium sp.]HPT46432.1 bile acid:sodium symporter family protein [Candidatus Rifleibacterium sp.]